MENGSGTLRSRLGGIMNYVSPGGIGLSEHRDRVSGKASRVLAHN
jgi:hypothetical protein